MRLDQLVASLQPERVHGPLDRPVFAVTQDSRQAGPDHVFVAITGARSDGRRFVPGLQVAAVVAEGPVQAEPGVTVIEVADARLALAQVAAALAGEPARSVPVVGITGTNGKTTTTWLLEGIAQAAGWPVGVLGTTGHRIAGQSVPTEFTTPEAPELQALLARCRDAGCRFVAMEVSSHGIAQQRVAAIPFAVAGFTSFSRDHLDFHGTEAAYLAAKRRLFRELVDPQGTAVLFADSPAIDATPTRAARTWRYRLGGPAELHLSGLSLGLDGSRGTVHTPMGSAPFRLRLLGAFNVENALCALGCALALGVPLDTALAGLAQVRAVPGRLEPVADPAGRHVLVDYAHTPDALRRTLATLAELDGGRVFTVVGCGGDRDRGKRPQMAQAACEGSHHVVLTSDNPRSEDPAAILADMAAGAQGSFEQQLDRRRAIEVALHLAEAGDIVLIAGKGHEQSQEIGGVRHPFDDRQVAAELIRQGRQP